MRATATAQRRTWGGALVALTLALVLMPVAALLAIEIAARMASAPQLERLQRLSPTVLAADGSLLRAYLAEDDHWRLPAKPEDVPADYLDLLLAYEDKRFYTHRGYDPLAMLRAATDAILHGRAVSGASTLTMQVARLLDPKPRTLWSKLREIVSARQLERSHSKREILGMYLTLAPFGGNIAGVRAASLSYFGKEPAHLTPAEAALLVAIPQSPERRRLDRHAAAAEDARRRMLARVTSRDGRSMQRASFRAGEGLPASPRGAPPTLAPHLADRLRREHPNTRTIGTTIAPAAQSHAESIARDALASSGTAVTVAIVIARNSDGAIVAHVGGSLYGSSTRAGYVDHAMAIRSPGSTLKPFIYALGFERRLIHPDTIVTDAPLGIGGYEPRNFSGGYRGDMTLRDALLASVNTTAVAVLSALGPRQLTSRLAAVGVPLKLDQPDGDVGLAVGLGGAGVRLAELVALYCGIANDGLVKPLATTPEALRSSRPARRLMDADAAWAIRNILADAAPPAGFVALASRDGGRRFAYKTGTSYSFRDAWAIGIDGTHTVGVWIGRGDGAPHIDAYGLTAAAPLLFRVMQGLPAPKHDVASEPPSFSLLAESGTLPERLKRFSANSKAEAANAPLHITFPREALSIAAGAGNASGLPLRLQGGEAPYVWLVNGRRIQNTESDSGDVWWRELKPGAARISVMDRNGAHDEVTVWIEHGTAGTRTDTP
ncbi:MAG: penicillin-binding protein 1C [Hyphomicrobiaceae bacterium]